MASKAANYQFLMELRKRHGAREGGKLYQKLLAIAFRLSGSEEVTERGVQGVDVDTRQADGRKYSIEVKTTVTRFVSYGQKDYDALEQRRRQDGYLPVLAVMRIQPLYEWYFAIIGDLMPGRILIESLRPCRLRDLELLIEPHFDVAVEEHFHRTLADGQVYLDRILRRCGVCVEDGPRD